MKHTIQRRSNWHTRLNESFNALFISVETASPSQPRHQFYPVLHALQYFGGYFPALNMVTFHQLYFVRGFVDLCPQRLSLLPKSHDVSGRARLSRISKESRSFCVLPEWKSVGPSLTWKERRGASLMWKMRVNFFLITIET